MYLASRPRCTAYFSWRRTKCKERAALSRHMLTVRNVAASKILRELPVLSSSSFGRHARTARIPSRRLYKFCASMQTPQPSFSRRARTARIPNLLVIYKFRASMHRHHNLSTKRIQANWSVANSIIPHLCYSVLEEVQYRTTHLMAKLP